tara:strand:- start:2144 stop:2746 length:603 start_codon:yes stop_codon:yes gene_type:complete
VTFPADYKQLLSQTVALGAGESRVILSPHFAPEKRYRLSITETSGLGRALITVDMLYSQNEQQIQFQVSPNGGTSIELSGSAVISGLAQGGPPTLDVNISEIMPSIDLIDFTENPVALGAAYVDLGSNGGFKQPFYNYAAVYLTAAADVALADLAGGIIWQAIGIGTGAPVLNQLRIGANQRLQARGVGVLATVVWYNRR